VTDPLFARGFGGLAGVPEGLLELRHFGTSYVPNEPESTTTGRVEDTVRFLAMSLERLTAVFAALAPSEGRLRFVARWDLDRRVAR
jgi:hypothetical protein